MTGRGIRNALFVLDAKCSWLGRDSPLETTPPTASSVSATCLQRNAPTAPTQSVVK